MSNRVRFASNIYVPNGAAAQHIQIILYIIRTDRDDECDTRHLKWGPC